jgi:hypothetical protein
MSNIYKSSELYATLQVSPRKRGFQAALDDDSTLTPKKLRTVSVSHIVSLILTS